MKLTESSIKALQPKKQRYTRSDNGLAIEVTPAGTKTFCFWHKGSKHTIGRWPDYSTKEARAEHIKRLADLADAPTERFNKLTFRAFVEGPYKQRGAAQRKRGDITMERLRFVYMTKHPLIAELQLNKITPEHIDQLKIEMLNGPGFKSSLPEDHPHNYGFAPSTAKRELSDLKHVFNRAVSWGYLKRSPAADVKMPTVDGGATKLHLSRDEVERLEAALTKWKQTGPFKPINAAGRGYYGDLHPQWFYILVRLLMNTGLRRGEALNLTWGDIDLDWETERDGELVKQGQITVRGSTAKTGQTRSVSIKSTFIKEMLEWHHEAHSESSEFGSDETGEVFSPNPDEPLFPVKSIRKPWERLRQMAKLDKTFTPHLLRHHFASILVTKRKVAIPTVMEILGHRDVQTIMRYLSVREEDMVDAIELL
ncbi:MAG: site-specific integrase [Pseudomonadaceae bacterium]|nr:site-specific integrase [Pseudomonadaceae bacterium]